MYTYVSLCNVLYTDMYSWHLGNVIGAMWLLVIGKITIFNEMSSDYEFNRIFRMHVPRDC